MINTPTIIEAASVAACVMSLITTLVALTRMRRMHNTTVAFEQAANKELDVLSNDVDKLSRQATEYSRRISSLESRSQSQTPQADEAPAVLNAKPTITERRHRVLSLARRGQDTQTIAQTLGMPHGEVELMINLGRAA